MKPYNERQGPVTIPGDLVRDLWEFVKTERDAAHDTISRIERINALLYRMKDACMSDHLATLDEVIEAWNRP